MSSTNQTAPTDLAAVMAKIAQIRALAERGGTRHEAEVAAAKMADLLLRYNLSLADIDAHARESGRRVVHESYETTAALWPQLLLDVIAQAHLCKAIRHGHGRMSVVGHEHNLIVVRETWGWLRAEAARLAPAAWQEAVAAGDGYAATQRARWSNDFKAGFVAGIDAAYRAMQRETRAAVRPSEWSIVPVLEAEVTQRYRELFPQSRERTHTLRGTTAYDRGKAAGRATNLGRQVGGSRSTAAIA